MNAALLRATHPFLQGVQPSFLCEFSQEFGRKARNRHYPSVELSFLPGRLGRPTLLDRDFWHFGKKSGPCKDYILIATDVIGEGYGVFKSFKIN
jgi:hypothetical protein